jgi:hypothetical protein
VDSYTDPVKDTVTETVTKIYATITGSSVNVRKGPGASYGAVTVIRRGAVVEILEQKEVDGKVWGRYENGWFRITGYATLKTVTTQVEVPKPSEPTEPENPPVEPEQPTEPENPPVEPEQPDVPEVPEIETTTKIYATITGYGETGPDAAAPGFDSVAFWTRSGFLMDLSVQSEGSYPVYPPTGAGDTVTGTALLGGVLAALYRREKTGQGDYVTAALQNAGLWMLASTLMQTQEKYGVKYPKTRAEASPFATSYKCADGEWFSITVLDHNRYRSVVFDLLGITEEMAPLNITTQEAMKQNSHKVIPVMERAFLKHTADEWLARFRAADVVCAKLNHMRDVFHDEQALANTFIQEYTCHNGEVCLMRGKKIRPGDVVEIGGMRYEVAAGEDQPV